MCSRSGLPAIGKSDFGSSLVNGRNSTPSPPAKIKTFEASRTRQLDSRYSMAWERLRIFEPSIALSTRFKISSSRVMVRRVFGIAFILYHIVFVNKKGRVEGAAGGWRGVLRDGFFRVI